MEFPKIFMFILILGVMYSLAMMAFAIWGYSMADSICENSNIKRSLQALVVGNVIYLVAIMTFGMICRRSCVVIFEMDDAGNQDTPTWFYGISALITLFNIIVSSHIYRLYKEENCDEKDNSNFSGILINLGIVTSIVGLVYSVFMLGKRWLKEREKTAPIRKAQKETKQQTRLASLIRDLFSKIKSLEERKTKVDESIASRNQTIPVVEAKFTEADNQRKQADQEIARTGKAPDNYNAIIRAYNNANAEKSRLSNAVKSETTQSQKLGSEISKYKEELNKALRKAGKEELAQEAVAENIQGAPEDVIIDQGN